MTETTATSRAELITQIRAAVRERVESTSLRSVSREVGFSPSGLQKFLDGGNPYPKGFRRLQAWWLNHHEQPPELDERDAAAALALLTVGMQQERRPKATEGVLAALRAGFANDPPAWLRSLSSSP